MRVLFIADQFADADRGEDDRHPGGAELTDEAAIQAAPWPVDLARATEIDPGRLGDYDLHLLGNLQTAPPDLLRALSRHGRHILFEHDVRICRWRGNFPSALDVGHRLGQRCTCPHGPLQQLYASALGAIFLTHRQLAVHEANPFFASTRNVVLGQSLFEPAFFERVRGRARGPRRAGTAAVLQSSNAIKGFEQARRFATARGWAVEAIRNLRPEEVLDLLGRVERFVYLPIGLEPAGRMPVEARFLGCEVITNANVGVAGESWWRLDDEAALDFLEDGPARFWRIVEELMGAEQSDSGASGASGAGVAVDLPRALAFGLMSLPGDWRRARARRNAVEARSSQPHAESSDA